MRKLDSFVSRSEEVLIGVLILTASIILFANVVARYVFNLGLPWAEELVRYQIVWMVFLGASVAARQGIHIGVDILIKFSPPAIGRVVDLAVHAIAVVFCAFVVFYGAELIAQTRAFGQISPAMQVPMWLVQLAIPVGSALMGLRFAQQFFRTLLRREQEPVHLEQIG